MSFVRRSRTTCLRIVQHSPPVRVRTCQRIADRPTTPPHTLTSFRLTPSPPLPLLCFALTQPVATQPAAPPPARGETPEPSEPADAPAAVERQRLELAGSYDLHGQVESLQACQLGKSLSEASERQQKEQEGRGGGGHPPEDGSRWRAVEVHRQPHLQVWRLCMPMISISVR